MSKLFTTIAGLFLLVGAAVHGYRLYHPFDVVVGGHAIPLVYSWPIAIGAALVGLMVFVEMRRR